MPLAGTGDLHHRKAVRGGIRQRHKPVEEAGRRHRQTDAGLLGEEPGRGRGVAGVAFVPETDVADAGRLRQAGQVGDRNPHDPVDGVHVVQLERVHNQMDPIGECALLLGTLFLRIRQGSNGHDVGPPGCSRFSLVAVSFPRGAAGVQVLSAIA
ncbi:hypothetical protein ACVWWN_006523 [Mycobacterium sp. URHB0021]